MDNKILGKFYSKTYAFQFSQRCFETTGKTAPVVMGDDNKYWVVNMVTFERLTKAGYTAAREAK